ncbi:MAG TPA: oligoendopeptidase F [Herpetosiphonaceae bacterium]
MATSAVPKRHELPLEYTWNLESFYANDEQWEQDFKRLEELIPQLSQLAGMIGQDAESMLDAFQQRDEANKLIEQLYIYAYLRQSENTANSRYQALFDRASSLHVRLGAATAFFEPEILAVSDERLSEFLASIAELRVYEHALKELRRQRDHIRSAEVEALLAETGEIARAPESVFEMLNNADIKFPVIKDEEGNDIELSQGRYLRLMESKNRDVRRSAFEAMYDTYGKVRNTTGTLLSSHIRTHMFYAKARNYGSSIEAALDPDAIPLAVYTNLVDTINANLHHLHRYMRLRKRLLKLDELHMYDIYVPLIGDVEAKYTYAQAREMMLAGMEPLGNDYVSAMRHGLYDGRWVDVYENEGKRSGAFSYGAYTSQPFILMNFQDNLESMFTLAHELGHSMHSFYTRRTQPYTYGHYTLFVAEVASTLNEALVVEHMLQNTDDRNLQLYLINHRIEDFRRTMFRQVMFAEFEHDIHRRAEAGEALTADRFSELYYELTKRYHGPDVVSDEQIALEWSRIPHFYSNFYVYKYATGIAASAALSKQILSEGQPAVERYLNFLKGGSSKTSIDLLRDAGVDMASPEPVQQACEVFGELVARMEELTADVK